MLVDMNIKRVVDFHGHLCPELAIGMKACEFARELLSKGEEPTGRISVLAENRTSALDAFQVLLGVTLGNQCLKVLDFGKHNYTFSAMNANKEFTLKLNGISYGDEYEFEILEEKIIHNQITMDEAVELQKFLNKRVLKLLSSSSEDLFDVVDAGLRTIQTIETPAVYLSCAGCGQLVLKEHAVEFWEKRYCIPCLQLLQHPKTVQILH